MMYILISILFFLFGIYVLSAGRRIEILQIKVGRLEESNEILYAQVTELRRKVLE